MNESSALTTMLTQCIESCRACADACEKMPGMKNCVLLCRDCADKCEQVLIRANVTQVLYRQCADACAKCAEECSRHEHDHCRTCAEFCPRCAELCVKISSTLDYQ